MGWREITSGDGMMEWERTDGHATIRLRHRADDRFAVRFDRLHQAPEGRAYEYEVVDTERDAHELVETLRSAYDCTD